MYYSIQVGLDNISKVIWNLLLDAVWIILCEVFVEITTLQKISEKSSNAEKPEHLRYYSKFLHWKQHWYIVFAVALYEHCAWLSTTRLCPLQSTTKSGHQHDENND